MANSLPSHHSSPTAIASDPVLWAAIIVFAVLWLFSAPFAILITTALVFLVIVLWRSSASLRVVSSQLRALEADSRSEIFRLRRELKVLDSQSRLGASALLQLADGVVVLSADLSILFINPSAIRFLGLGGRDSPLNRSFPEIVRNPKMTQLIGLAISERQPQESVFEIHQSSTLLPLRIRADVIDDVRAGDDEDSFKVQLSLRDETESRQVEGMRREFIANVSHELKTPLAAIKGYAETVQLAAPDDPEMATHFMNSIMVQCQRLERLVSDMMQLARAQSGRALMNVSSISLRDVVADSVRTYAPVAEAGGLKLTFDRDQRSAKVLADPEAAITIANNLIGNAIRYTPRGGSIQVTLEEQPSCWALVVTDTGVGIAEKEQARIFERFYRGSRSTEMATSSTGLGLAIVKNLAIALGGRVSVNSRLGEGSRFVVELPSVQTQAESKSDAIAPPIALVKTESQVDPKTQADASFSSLVI